MKIYHYDMISGESLGAGEARNNPAFGELDQPEYLIPAAATTIAPPSVGQQQAALFVSGAWCVVPDLRGTTAWTTDGQAVEITELGKSLADLGLLSDKPPISLTDAKAAKLTEILTGSDAAMNAITSTYSENEKFSWPKQEAEAKALLADPSAPAPLLRGIADTRGIALTVLRDKVLANVEASEALTALILGTQQRYEDAVKAATTVEDVQAIEVKYGGI